MKATTASMLFLGICLTLAALLVTDVISIMVSSVVFALALVILGGASRGFRKHS